MVESYGMMAIDRLFGGVRNPYYEPPTPDNTKVTEDKFHLRQSARGCNCCQFEDEHILSERCAWCKYSGNTVSEAQFSQPKRA
jgi:uncharacterized paraquat-inducible protein A